MLKISAQVNPIVVFDSMNVARERIEENIIKGFEELNQKTTPQPLVIDSINWFDSLHGKIVISIKNLRNKIGAVNVALFNSYSSFSARTKPFRGARAEISGNSIEIIFDSIPSGTYTVAAFHDEDRNGVLKTNQINIPLEGYCFSNNIAATMGPPEYNRIKFFYNGKNKKMVLYMTYFNFPR
jgi:uncharacterized protein (DUF2141 family)